MCCRRVLVACKVISIINIFSIILINNITFSILQYLHRVLSNLIKVLILSYHLHVFYAFKAKTNVVHIFLSIQKIVNFEKNIRVLPSF